MNVPADNDSTMEIFLHKLRYMVIGVFTPELISMLAYSDLRDAHTIVTAVNREQVGPPPRKFYVLRSLIVY